MVHMIGIFELTSLSETRSFFGHLQLIGRHAQKYKKIGLRVAFFALARFVS